MVETEDGIVLAPLDVFLAADIQRTVLSKREVSPDAGEYVDSFTCQERYVVTGSFTFEGTGDFGFAFDYNNRKDRYKLVSFSPEQQAMTLSFNLGTTPITSVPVSLEAGTAYTFTYVQEGSVGILYLDGQAALTVRIYGVSGRAVKLYSEDGGVTFTDLKQFTYSY